MAREIVVSYQGQTSRLPLRRVDRSKLYGRKRRLVVDALGNPCTPALLTIDGSVLLPAGGVASQYVDQSFDSVEREDLLAVDALGNELPRIESSLGDLRVLEGPVPDSRVLDVSVTSVYQLDEHDLAQPLLEALARGEIFETRFNFRRSTRESPLFLVRNEEGLFALVGTETGFAYASYELPASDTVAGEDDPFDGELDVSF